MADDALSSTEDTEDIEAQLCLAARRALHLKQLRSERLSLLQTPPKTTLSVDEKRESHAEAQHRFRAKNLEDTRAKARERTDSLSGPFSRLRAKRDSDEVLAALAKRREAVKRCTCVRL
ncbi:hypothetical protein DFH09DRAFT_1318032 [Mycena vulgaris]|nr:hypothetical protein DFH09DRAFT_1318032 [Mycena vulgaris]